MSLAGWLGEKKKGRGGEGGGAPGFRGGSHTRYIHPTKKLIFQRYLKTHFQPKPQPTLSHPSAASRQRRPHQSSRTSTGISNKASRIYLLTVSAAPVFPGSAFHFGPICIAACGGAHCCLWRCCPRCYRTGFWSRLYWMEPCCWSVYTATTLVFWR